MIVLEFERRCWAEVDLGALRHNFELVRRAADGAAVIAVVKADAYGHGDAAVARLLEGEGADGFAVSGFEEAMRLRRAGVEAPILILGYTGAENAAALSENNITQTVFSSEYAQELSDAACAAGVTVRIHIKLDTGMSRIGFDAVGNADTVAAVESVCRLPGLHAAGIFTHFAVADSTLADDVSFTHAQYARMCAAVDELSDRGVTFETVHCCNSAGTFAYPEFHRDAVRPGIILYGENPSAEVTLPGLRSAMRLKCCVSMVKELPAGRCISYGRTFESSRPMRVATLTVGYADGYPRAMSNRGIVEICGKPARVLGRVCMDQMMVDVTDIPEAAAGDASTVFGGDVSDSVETLAHTAGTIPYEILCSIGRRVPRLYLDGGREVDMVNYLRGV